MNENEIDIKPEVVLPVERKRRKYSLPRRPIPDLVRRKREEGDREWAQRYWDRRMKGLDKAISGRIVIDI